MNLLVVACAISIYTAAPCLLNDEARQEFAIREFKSAGDFVNHIKAVNAGETKSTSRYREELSFALTTYWTRYLRQKSNDAHYKFVGLLEFAIQYDAPDWFLDALDEPIRSEPIGRLSLNDWHRRDRKSNPSASNGIRLPKESENHGVKQITRLERGPDFVEWMTDRGHRFKFRRPLYDELANSHGWGIVYFFPISKARVIIANPGIAEHEYMMACYDRNGEEIWHQTIWCGFRNGMIVKSGWGRMNHLLRIEEDRDRLLVFGVIDNSVYVEVFASDDGKPILRFSTTYSEELAR